MDETVGIKEIHKVLLKILVDFDRICRKHNLTYYMVGGTLLGAVRHRGFIPWDDDIDIGMPRPDYERFMKLSEIEFPSYLQVWNRHKRPGYFMLNFSKLVNTETSMTPIENPDYTIGLFLDIFPIDGSSNYSLFRKVQIKLIRFFQVLRSYKYLSKLHKKDSLKSFFIKSLASIFSGCIHPILDRLVTTYDYSTSAYAGNLLGVYGIKEILPKDVFGKPTELEFEGHSFYAPQKYDLWLKQVYGNYMVLPPINKRCTPHEYVSINLNQSCL